MEIETETIGIHDRNTISGDVEGDCSRNGGSFDQISERTQALETLMATFRESMKDILAFMKDIQ